MKPISKCVDWHVLHFILGRCQRLGPGDSQHLQRASSVPHLLADLRHHGRADVCGKILQGESAFGLLLSHLAWTVDKGVDLLGDEVLFRLPALAFGFQKLDANQCQSNYCNTILLSESALTWLRRSRWAQRSCRTWRGVSRRTTRSGKTAPSPSTMCQTPTSRSSKWPLSKGGSQSWPTPPTLETWGHPLICLTYPYFLRWHDSVTTM